MLTLMLVRLRTEGHFNWCTGTYPVVPGYGDRAACVMDNCDGRGTPAGGTASGTFTSPPIYPPALWKDVPDGLVLAAYGGQGGVPIFVKRGWPSYKTHSFGAMYLCPLTCRPPAGGQNANTTHLLGMAWRQVEVRRLMCPFW